jgi:hypothetical protein
VPGGSGEEPLVCGPVDADELRVVGVYEDDLKLLKADALCKVQLVLNRWRKCAMPGEWS